MTPTASGPGARFLPAEATSEPVQIAAAQTEPPADGGDDGSGDGAGDGSAGTGSGEDSTGAGEDPTGADDTGANTSTDADGGPTGGADQGDASATDDLPSTGAAGITTWVIAAFLALAAGTGLVAIRRRARA